jgi:hypothetical protein
MMHTDKRTKDKSPAELLADNHPQKLRPLPEIGPNGRTVRFGNPGLSGLQPEPRITRTRRWSDAAKATAKFIGWGLAAILLTVIVAAFVYYVT